VYALLEILKAYRPKVVVKGTPTSFCICGDEIHPIRDHSEWYVWSYPHPEHWELPPRNNWDRENRASTFPNVNMEHWGESYWGKRWIECESLVACVGTDRCEDEAQIYETRSSIRLTSIVTPTRNGMP
jgi:hypothetical protein